MTQGERSDDVERVAERLEEIAARGIYANPGSPDHATFKQAADLIRALQAGDAPDVRASVVEECARVADAQHGVAQSLGPDVSAGWNDCAAIIAAAIRQLAPTAEQKVIHPSAIYPSAKDIAGDDYEVIADEWTSSAEQKVGLWMPIETAPRDGKAFLWCSADGLKRHVIAWPSYKECFEEGWWQPLPAPPTPARG